jgi:hypothetical protein
LELIPITLITHTFSLRADGINCVKLGIIRCRPRNYPPNPPPYESFSIFHVATTWRREVVSRRERTLAPPFGTPKSGFTSVKFVYAPIPCLSTTTNVMSPHHAATLTLSGAVLRGCLHQVHVKHSQTTTHALNTRSNYRIIFYLRFTSSHAMILVHSRHAQVNTKELTWI